MTTITLASWFTASYYVMRAGGPMAIGRALRNPNVPRRWKLVLALCALPIPGPADEIVAAAVLSKLAREGKVIR